MALSSARAGKSPAGRLVGRRKRKRELDDMVIDRLDRYLEQNKRRPRQERRGGAPDDDERAGD